MAGGAEEMGTGTGTGTDELFVFAGAGLTGALLTSLGSED